MNRHAPESLAYYDRAVTDQIMQKYGLDRETALRRFVTSRTHAMLEDNDYGLFSVGAPGIFDIWESEIVTGDPGNSIYIRGE